MYATVPLKSHQAAQLERLLREVRDPILQLGHSRKRKRVSETTSYARLYCFTRFLKVLIGIRGYQIKSVSSLGERHVRVYCEYLLRKKLSPSMYANVVTHLKIIFASVLKKPCIQEPKTYFGDAVTREFVSKTSLAWEDLLPVEGDSKYSPKEVRRRISDRCEGTGLLTELCHTLGLRAKEALFFRPHEDWFAPMKVRVRPQGSKGGRERILDLETFPAHMRAEAIDVLTRVKDYVKSERGTVLEPRTQSLRWITNLRHVYWVVRLEGVAKRSLGITLHGLRHGFLQRLKEGTTGTPVPVHGTLSEHQTRDVRQCALEAVTRAIAAETAGHSRTAITSTYYGSPSQQWADSGGDREHWNLGKRFLADIERGAVEALHERLRFLQDPDCDLDALLNDINERLASRSVKQGYV